MSSATWNDGWAERLYESAERIGFGRVLDFVQANPGKTFGELAALLGPHVAPIQVETLEKREAIRCGEFGWFARDCLSRRIRERLEDGWGKGADLDFRRAAAFGAWEASLGDQYKDLADAVWRNLVENPPEKDWLPGSADDAVLVSMFQNVDFGA